MTLPLQILTVNWFSSEYLNTNLKYSLQRNGLEKTNWLVVDNSETPDSLDPLYLTRPLEDILNEMAAENLAFLGAEYSNLTKPLYKGWPCAYCMFIDLEQVNPDDLDFRAGFASIKEKKQYCGHPDTGWRVFDRFSKEKSARFFSNSYNEDLPFICDYYKGLGGYHLRAKIEENKRSS